MKAFRSAANIKSLTLMILCEKLNEKLNFVVSPMYRHAEAFVYKALYYVLWRIILG
jgi:hypothetical protein